MYLKHSFQNTDRFFSVTYDKMNKNKDDTAVNNFLLQTLIMFSTINGLSMEYCVNRFNYLLLEHRDKPLKIRINNVIKTLANAQKSI